MTGCCISVTIAVTDVTDVVTVRLYDKVNTIGMMCHLEVATCPVQR